MHPRERSLEEIRVTGPSAFSREAQLAEGTDLDPSPATGELSLELSPKGHYGPAAAPAATDSYDDDNSTSQDDHAGDLNLFSHASSSADDSAPLAFDAGAPPPPQSKGMPHWIVFSVIGVATLLGWNAVLSSVDYLALVYPRVKNPLLTLTAAFQIPNLLVILLLSVYGQLITFRIRFVLGFGFYVFYLSLLPVIAEEMDPATGWDLFVALTVVAGAANGATEASLYGYANQFGPAALQKSQGGQSMSGVIISICRVTTKLLFLEESDGENGTRASAFLYFAIGAFLSLVCVLLFYAVTSLRSESKKRDRRIDFSLVKEAWGHVRHYSVVLGSNYIVTLAIFPGLVVSLVSSEFFSPESGWLPTLLIAAFNVMDWIGKEFGAMGRWRLQNLRQLMVEVAVRIVLLPVFLLCVHGYLSNDMFFFFITAVLGLSNGHASVNSFILAEGALPCSDRQRLTESAGYIMILGLVLGIAVGVLLALPVNLI